MCTMNAMRRTRPFALRFLVVACAAWTGCAQATSRDLARPPASPDVKEVDVVIQGAVDSEVQPLVESLSESTPLQIGAWTFWRGRLGDKRVVVSRTEVGPINAAAATTLAILTFHPRLIINQGTAGATSPDLRVFDIVAGEATVDYGAFSTSHADSGEGSDSSRWIRMPHQLRLGGGERIPLPVFPGDPEVLALALAQPHEHGRVVKGVIGSAFQFNREVDRLVWIRERYEAISEDMESAFAAGTALGFNTPFLAIRIISDSEFHAPGVNPRAAGYCAEFVARLVSRLPRQLLSRPAGIPRAGHEGPR